MSTEESEAGNRVFLEDDDDEEEEEYESVESVPSPKRPKASDIWEGFTILKQNGSNGNLAKCSTCKRILANSSKSGTSLWTSLDSIVKHQTGADFNAARRAMAMLIITSGESLSLVEGYGFQCFLRIANPQFRICRSTLDRDITNLYEREKVALQCIMSEAPGRISFAVDHWKGKETGDNYVDDSYICVTACFVDADWKLQRIIVGFRLLTFPDDATSVADTVALCFSELRVDKVMCITLDNALYDASVANSLKTILQDKGKLLRDGEFCQLHCCTDILNSVVQAGLEMIDDVIDKIREGIHYITFSGIREDGFYQYARDICHLDVTMKLRADLVVCWDSTYKMLGCALFYKDALKHFASTDDTFLSNFHLGDEEWNKVVIMEKFLKPLYEVTCTFLSKKHKTANLYFLGVYKVYRLLEVTKEQENFMSAMVKAMKVKFDKYWSEYSLILACAAVLDPRYNLNLISYCFRKIYGDADASQHIDRVVALLHALLTEYEKSSSCLAAVGSGVVEYHTKDDLFDDYVPQEQKSELDWYLESPSMHLNIDLDILEFWSGMSKCYPNLANLARDIFAIPISTVASKSAFTMGEKVLSPRRSALRPDLLERLICLHDWTCPKDREGNSVSAIEEHISAYYDDEDVEESYDDEEEEDDDDVKESDDDEEEDDDGADNDGDD